MNAPLVPDVRRRWLLALSLTLVLSGCQARPVTPGASGKTVIDYFGNEIALPETVGRIVSLSGVVSEYVVIVGARDRLVGISRRSKGNNIFHRLFPAIDSLPAVGDSAINIEHVAALKPDVVLCSHDRDLIDRIEQLGVPAVGTFPRNIEGIFGQIQVVGVVAGRTTQADRVIGFLRTRLDAIESVTRTIPDHRRPRIYYARFGPFETYGRGTFSDVIAAAGGTNVVADLGTADGPMIVSLENIAAWNPDVIVIRDSNPLTPAQLYEDPDWQGISAVRNRKVYKEHFGWSEYRTETVFGIMEKATWFHPALFKAIDPAADHEQFFRLVESFYR